MTAVEAGAIAGGAVTGAMAGCADIAAGGAAVSAGGFSLLLQALRANVAATEMARTSCWRVVFM
ncbi:MAG: hypothetical protein ABI379_05835 [Rhodanobacter sp.]